MEASSHLLETRVFGRDQSVRKLLRATLTSSLAAKLLMSDLATFARLPPDIEMEPELFGGVVRNSPSLAQPEFHERL